MGSLLAPSRPRMGFVVDAGQVLEVKVRIYLRRTDVGMAEKFLPAAEVPARLEQVGGERVPEEMRVHRHVQVAARGPAPDPALDRARAEAPAVLADEEGAGAVLHQSLALAEP